MDPPTQRLRRDLPPQGGGRATSHCGGSKIGVAKILGRHEWAERTDVWQGEFEGGLYGADVSVMFYTTDEIGGGPKLHKHPYAEVFIVRQRRALITVGTEQIEATAGQIIFAPADVPHKFSNLGPGRLETTDLHVTSAFSTEWLEA